MCGEWDHSQHVLGVRDQGVKCHWWRFEVDQQRPPCYREHDKPQRHMGQIDWPIGADMPDDFLEGGNRLLSAQCRPNPESARPEAVGKGEETEAQKTESNKRIRPSSQHASERCSRLSISLVMKPV